MKSLLAVPISFVSEHIETLEEIDMEYRELALESGVKNWGRVPALNTHPKFIEDLADAVMEALPYVGVIAGNPSDSLVPMGEYGVLGSWFHEAWFHSQRWATRHQRGAKPQATLAATHTAACNGSSTSSNGNHAAGQHEEISSTSSSDHHSKKVPFIEYTASSNVSNGNGHRSFSDNGHSSNSNDSSSLQQEVGAAAPAAAVPQTSKRTVSRDDFSLLGGLAWVSVGHYRSGT